VPLAGAAVRILVWLTKVVEHVEAGGREASVGGEPRLSASDTNSAGLSRGLNLKNARNIALRVRGT
jgi:hypothetical protein